MLEVNEFLKLIDSYIGSAWWFPYALLGTGLFFTIYLKFPQIRFFKHAIRIVSGKYDKSDLPGDTSHFQALATALSGTVGTGNIAGVAFAVHLGGPAALFWMLVTAAVGMCTKFVEVSLSHKYRTKLEDGTMAGGPMYYMKNAEFKLNGKKVNLKWLAVIFAFATVLSSFGTGSLPQINSISSTLLSTFGIDQIVTGAVLAVLLGLVIIGGIQRIAAVTSKLVPGMAIIYFIGAFAVILANIGNIVPSFMAIFGDIFTGSAATGGFIGANLAFAFNKGVGRGLFSNEAGQGSAPIAHASAKANEPLSEGMVAILEPFIDTIIICTVTGLVLLSSGAWSEKHVNQFDYTEIEILSESLKESNPDNAEAIYKHLNGVESLPEFTGSLVVVNGEIQNSDITLLHSRSFADNVLVYKNDGILDEELFSGTVAIEEGSIIDDQPLKFIGESLVHSAPLTAIAFNRGFFGDYGQYIVSIGLLLFAFSTAISWSYYGDRAMTFLFGTKSVIYYRIVYVIAFFFASFQDTTIIWTLSGITIALMTLPNLVGIIWLRKDMKNTISEYGDFFEENFPGMKHPKFK
ncbi:MAG: sodium:alanine symporter family protein [Flammeovirgaceae bacterium]|nr:sodium:alanine symporter family protein [Flammeovirgaceae bacterium]MBE62047.1 sodium:alanine symporter family protein [Flammeovirgaceae bacterium]MBR11122.1 sodium:alanine symporter family protein [Rickettsiales bacterium]HCX21749.1 sodium:alanine symporter family protein [Cytophagales bacterium]